ncbi:Uncharacterised protein [Klebsiella pneumoniae]|nr:Uncharacterised protein [Klebsiella pneumoniae]
MNRAPRDIAVQLKRGIAAISQHAKIREVEVGKYAAGNIHRITTVIFDVHIVETNIRQGVIASLN